MTSSPSTSIVRQALNPAKALIIFSLLYALFLITACSTPVQVANWRELPKGKKIQIVTRSGSELVFDNWLLTPDSVFVGFSRSMVRTMPHDSIQAGYVFSTSMPKALSTAIIVVGVGAGIALLWMFYDAVKDGVGIGKIG